MRARHLFAVVLMLVFTAQLSVGQSVESLMSAGQQMLHNGAYSQAIVSFRKVLQRDPSQFEAQHNIAFAYLQMGRYADAVREFKRAINMNGKNAETWANLAFAYEAMGNSQKAIDALYASVNLDPGNITARLNLATMYVNEDQLSKAIREFKEVISIDGSNVEAYTNLAKCLINAKKHDEAVRYLKEAISQDPGNAEAHWELGNILFDKQKDAEKAAKEYQVAISLQSDDPRFYSSLADAYIAMENKDEAVETLERSMVFIADALMKERVQKRINRIQGKTDQGAPMPTTAGPSANTDDMASELQKDLRGDDENREKTVTQTGPIIDLSDDFSDLSDDDDDELDLEKEARKRAKK